MTEKDFENVCSTIDEEKEFLNSISQSIWKKPELKFEEFHAHALLTDALTKHGFLVEKHYFLATAFKGEYRSKQDGGPTIAILLEYDALPDIGHGCGHNLIAEAGLGAAIAVKKVMELDSTIAGKLIVLGTPAEEGGGGKIRLIEQNAFKEVDAAMMVHPALINVLALKCSNRLKCDVQFSGKEAHAASSPWEGRNALDAAVACYCNIALLRQQIGPTCRIHVIIIEGGVAHNIIPAKSRLVICVRSSTVGQLENLLSRVEHCITGAATSTGCDVSYEFDRSELYQNVITNKILGNLYKDCYKKLGKEIEDSFYSGGSTDMGNVCHVVPGIHPIYSIPSKDEIHTTVFKEAAGSPEAQEPTLASAKAMAMTTITLMRSPDIVKDIKEQFKADILHDSKIN